MKSAMEVKPNNAPSYCALYPGLAEICIAYGYALAIHGSMARDFDLIAVPWVDAPALPETVIEAITTDYAIHYIASETNPEQRLHGRMAYTLCVMGEWQLDLSFMPIGAPSGTK